MNSAERKIWEARQASRPVRVGDTLRRPRNEDSAYVDALLRHLAEAGFTGAPRPLGYDEDGRQILTFIEGDVPHGEGPYLLPDAKIRSATRLIRAFHDATAGFRGAAVVCHGDLGPHNTVFRGDEAIAIIDFEDGVGPGNPVDDFAQAVWGFADLLDRTVPVAEQARRSRLMCDVYGTVTPAEVVQSLLDRFRRAIDQHRAAGLPGPQRVFEHDLAWLTQHAAELR